MKHISEVVPSVIEQASNNTRWLEPDEDTVRKLEQEYMGTKEC